MFFILLSSYNSKNLNLTIQSFIICKLQLKSSYPPKIVIIDIASISRHFLQNSSFYLVFQWRILFGVIFMPLSLFNNNINNISISVKKCNKIQLKSYESRICVWSCSISKPQGGVRYRNYSLVHLASIVKYICPDILLIKKVNY